jgi:hypothetical protein
MDINVRYINYYSYLDKYIRNRLTEMFKGEVIELQWRILGVKDERSMISYTVDYAILGSASGMIMCPTYEDYIQSERDKKINDLLDETE